MKRVGGNDIVDLVTFGITDDRANPVRMMHHDREFPDLRAKYVFDFLRSWGYAAAFGEMLADHMCDAHSDGEKTTPRKPPTPNDLAMRACEIVDAAWDELTHRGWIVKQPSISDD